MKKRLLSSILVIAIVFVSVGNNVFASRFGDRSDFIPYANQEISHTSEWFNPKVSEINLIAYEDLKQYDQRWNLLSVMLSIVQYSPKLQSNSLLSSDGVWLTEFSDINKLSSQAQEEVKILKKLGVLNGILTDDGLYLNMDQHITRAEAAKIISVFYQKIFYIEPVRTTLFTDISSHWAESYIKYCYERELLNGRSDETYDPNSYITKEEVITIILNLYEKSNGTVHLENVCQALNETYNITTKYEQMQEEFSEILFKKNYYSVELGETIDVKIEYDENKTLYVYTGNDNISIRNQKIRNGIAEITVYGKLEGTGVLKAQYTSGNTEPVDISIYVNDEDYYLDNDITIKLNDTKVYLNIDDGDVYRIGNNIRVTPRTTEVYYVSEDPDIATVNLNTGLVRPQSKGVTYIYIIANGVKKKIKVSVRGNSNNKDIELIENSCEVYVGETKDISALIQNVDNRKVTYTSSDRTIATVDSSGKVTTKSSGDVTIKITCASVTVNYKLTVKDTELTIIDIYFNQEDIILEKGKTLDLNKYYETNPASASRENIIYHSDDKNIVEVDDDGVITGVSVGETTIQLNTGMFAKTIKVKVPEKETVVLEPKLKFYSDNIELSVGMDFNIYSLLGNYSGKSITFSLSDETVATLQGNHIISKKVGETTLTASDDKGNSVKLLIKVN